MTNYCQTCGNPLPSPPGEACPLCGVKIPVPAGSAGIGYAGVWDRFAAYLVDFIAGLILAVIVFAVIALGSSLVPGGIALGVVIGLCCAFLVYWLYYAVFECSSYQATPGKLLLKIRVVNDNGYPLSFPRSLARSFFKILFTLSPASLLALVGGIIIQISDTRKGIHDYLVSTRVVTSPGHDDSSSGVMIIIIIVAGLFVLIAITVLLAAIIAAFVFGMAGNISAVKVVAATVQQTDSGHIIITYQGGQDAGSLRQVTATVMDSAGTSQVDHMGLMQGSMPLDVGSSLTFTGAFAGKDHVVATGSFFDGSEQVILDTYV
jgi:archaeal type IV pilus assembly protein PilA